MHDVFAGLVPQTHAGMLEWRRAAGDPGPWRQQAILGRRDWDADGLRDIVRDYIIEHLADDDAVLVIALGVRVSLNVEAADRGAGSIASRKPVSSSARIQPVLRCSSPSRLSRNKPAFLATRS
jgi:hypothetical protein